MRRLLFAVLILPAFAWCEDVTVVDQMDGIEVLKLRPNFFMIAGAGSNIAVQTGELGAVVVDTGSAPMTDRVLQAIRKLTPLPIRYIINTSADPDHVGGNEKFSVAGQSLVPIGGQPSGEASSNGVGNGGAAVIFASENVLMRMSAPTGKESPYPTGAQPANTYAESQKDTFLNGEAIQVFAAPAAHTDGDSMVFFRRSDILVAGDVLDLNHFPIIDLAKGGSIQGELDALNHILDITVPELPMVWEQGGTWVIPGHGRICDEADIVEYRDMVTIVRDVIQDLMNKGKTLDEIKKANPAAEYRGRYGSDSGEWTTDMFIEAIYKSLGNNKR